MTSPRDKISRIKPDDWNQNSYEYGHLYYYGRICKNGHEYKTTGMCLRYLSTRSCVFCTYLKSKNRVASRLPYYANRAKQPAQIEKNIIYRKKNALKIKIRQKEYNLNRGRFLKKESAFRKIEQKLLLTNNCSICKSVESLKPSHCGSANCESGSIASGGKNTHCSCDTCF